MSVKGKTKETRPAPWSGPREPSPRASRTKETRAPKSRARRRAWEQVGGRMSVKVLSLKDNRGKIRLSRRAALTDAAAAAAAAASVSATPPAA